MYDLINIVESLQKSSLLIVGTSETVKHEIKKKECGFLPAMMAPMAASLIAPLTSSLTKPETSSMISSITKKGVMRAGKGQHDGILPLLALPLMVKAKS